VDALQESTVLQVHGRYQSAVAVSHDTGDIEKRLEGLHEHGLSRRREAEAAAAAARDELNSMRNDQPVPAESAS